MHIMLVYGESQNELHLPGNEIKELIKNYDKIHIKDREIVSDTIYDNVILIKNQIQFDSLSSIISDQLYRFQNILVKIDSGVYFCNTDHIFLRNVDCPNSRLSIKGDGRVIIMATSGNLLDIAKDYKGGYKVIENYQDTTVNPEEIFTDGKNVVGLSVKNYLCNSGVSFVEELFEKIHCANEQDFQYRLKSSLLPDMSNYECRNLWLWTTHSWVSVYEKIDSVVNGYIYITANRKYEKSGCSLNTEYKIWNIKPRIKVVNYEPSSTGIYIDPTGRLFLPVGYASIYKCDKGSFLRSINSEIRSVEISGIEFVGGHKPIIDINYVTDYAYIHNCEFLCQQNLSIRLKTNNGVIKNNLFRNSMGSVIEIPNGGYTNHIISDNKFSECGQRLLNFGCIQTECNSVLISKNYFHNNLIAAINIGVWHASEPKGKIFSIIEDNVIYNDNSVLDKYLSNSLLDRGLIYVYTKNDQAIVRRNRVHGLRSFAGGNGIYVDDGAYNVCIYDNIVTGIEGNFYNINCRAEVRSNVKENAPSYSTNNFIAYNIIDGPIRFEVRTDEPSIDYPQSTYGGNIFLLKKYSEIKNKFVNVSANSDLHFYANYKGLVIRINSKDYDSIINCYGKDSVGFVKKWISYSDD